MIPYFLSHTSERGAYDLRGWFEWFWCNGIPCGIIKNGGQYELWRMGEEAAENPNTLRASGELIETCHGFGEALMEHRATGSC